MPLRNVKHHSKCAVCAQLAEQRLQCLEKKDIAAVDALKAKHINLTMADRAVNVRGNRLSCKGSGPNSLLKAQIIIHGMGQAKCMVPRPKNLLGTSTFAQLWKPTQHITGLIFFLAALKYFSCYLRTHQKILT